MAQTPGAVGPLELPRAWKSKPFNSRGGPEARGELWLVQCQRPVNGCSTIGITLA